MSQQNAPLREEDGGIVSYWEDAGLERKKLGLIGAMDEEIAFFHEHMSETREVRHAGIDYFAGRLFGRDAVFCKCGVGKVNAAICTQVLIYLFEVDAVVFTGVAGALDPELEIGDVVVSGECMQHDMDVSALGYARGIIPYQELSLFPADPELKDLALRAGEKLFPGRVSCGRVLSGDQFIASREKVEELHRELGGTCAEMEGAAVAQVCSLNAVPYVVIRSMSDKADGSAPGNFTDFASRAAENSFRLVRELISALPAIED